MYFASLNCPTLDCPTLFALATDETTQALLIYTILHGLAFVVFGLIGALVMAGAERYPMLIFGLVILFTAFEVFFFGGIVIVASWVLDEVAGWTIFVGNILAAGSMLAGVLVLLCLVLLVAEALARGRARFSRIGAGAPRAANPIRLGRTTIAAETALIALTVLALGVPGWTIVRWLWIGGTKVWVLDDIATALGQTIGLATVAAALTTVLAFPVAWVAVRSSGVLARVVEGANYVTSSLPGIVTALALVTVTIHAARPLYQSVALIVFAYVLLFIPRALVNVRAGLAQVPPGLEEASRSLGSSPAATFLRVTLRLTAPAAAAGASLVFVAVATELTATLLLAPTGTNTLSMRFWSLSSELDYAAAAPYALVLVVLAIPVTLVLFRQSTKVAAL